MLVFSIFSPWLIYADEWQVQENEVAENIGADQLLQNGGWEEKNEISDEYKNENNENSDNENLNLDNDGQNFSNQTADSSWFLSDSVDNEIIFNENDDKIKVTNAEPDFDLENCFEWNWPYIKKYLCDDTEIIIPENAKWVFWEAFAWKTINNITFLSTGTTLYQQVFSGAVLQWVMTLPWENPSQGYLFEWSTIWEEWVITMNKWMRTYHTNILWTVIVDWSDWMFNSNYLFQNSYIDGTVILSWFNWIIDYWFYWIRLTENWKIIIWEWITKINNSFQRVNWEWEILWEIIFPDSLESINQSFYWIPINSHFNFPNGLREIKNSFYVSYNYPITLLSGVSFEWNESLEIDYAFINAQIDWGLSIIWSWISLKNIAPSNVSWSVVISWENIRVKDGAFYYYQLWGSIIDWTVIISGNNINEMRWFSNAKIWGDIKLIWNNININYWLWSQAHIQWDFIISWNNIESKYWSTTALNVSWSVLITWNFVDLWYWFLDPSNTDWDIRIKGNEVKLMYTALNNANIGWNIDIESNSTSIGYNALEGLRIWWNLNISWNIEYFPSSLTSIEADKVILNIINTKPQMKVLTWNLIINNSDNVMEGAFSWVIVSNNIYLNWEISKVWASAYAFASWTIQPITLSNDFQTWDIGENAFCINWKPVVAYTMKEVSQEDRNYLLQHACLDIKSAFNITFNVDWNIETIQYNWRNTDDIPSPTKNWYEFLWWFEENSETPFDFENTPITEDKTLFAKWKALEEKAQETAAQSVVYTNETTVTIWDDVQEEKINNSSLINLVSKEVESENVETEEQKITVQESEIQVTSDKTVEYQWWLEVYLEKTTNIGEEETKERIEWTEETKERIEWTAKFSSPVAVKIPITSNAETVKVQVKHEWEEFWYKGLTTNPINSCVDWESVNDKYNWESITVKDSWEWKYVLIYTCSASTFVAYTENKKSVDNTAVATPSAWGWRSINTISNTQEKEHNSADINEQTENKASTTTSDDTVTVEENIKKYSNIKLTRWEVAVMTNILLDVFPQLVEWKQELDDVENACSNYVDEQKFTKDEKKAITRLCKLSIMWIHADDNRPLEEFLVNNNTTNDEFSKVINRSISTYNEKDLSAVKDALKKLENNEDDVVFWTLYDMFMSIKNIVN